MSSDVIEENRSFLEDLAEQDHLRISKYARAMLKDDGDSGT